jgi:hypothetical protein
MPNIVIHVVMVITIVPNPSNVIVRFMTMVIKPTNGIILMTTTL